MSEAINKMDFKNLLETLMMKTPRSNEDIFVEPILSSKCLCGQKISSELIKLKDLFEETKGKSPKRILLEGEAGYGKTHLSNKLTSDWLKGESYIKQRFDYVFILSLRNGEDDFEEVLFQQYRIVDITKQDLLERINSSKERILIILDGFDVLGENSKTGFIPLLKGEQYPLTTVIVTSRLREKELPNLNKMKLNRKSNALYLIDDDRLNSSDFIWDKIIQIEGISSENRLNFIADYLSPEIITCKRDILHQVVLEDVYESPLNLQLLAILIDDKEICSLKTKTELLKKFLNLLITQNLLKKNLIPSEVIPSEEEIDVFGFCDVECKPGYVDLLLKFGETLYEMPQPFDLQLIEEELQKQHDFLELFTSLKDLTRKKLMYSDSMYKTLLEFLVAFYISQECLSSPSSVNGISILVDTVIERGLIFKFTYLVFPFLFGILSDKAYYFLQSLSRFAGFFPINGEFFRNVYTEISLTKENQQSLLPFIPPYWEVEDDRFFRSAFHSTLLQLSCQNNAIQKFVWDLEYVVTIPQNFHVNVLRIILISDLKISLDCIRGFKLSCLRLGFETFMIRKYWDAFVSIVSSVTSVDISFTIRALTDDVTHLFCKKTLEKWTSERRIREIVFTTSQAEVVNHLDVIQNCQEQNLKDCLGMGIFEWYDHEAPNFLESFLNAVVSSNLLEKFMSIGGRNQARRRTKVNRSRVTYMRKKTWKFLFIDENLKYKLYENNTDALPIDSIKIHYQRKQNVQEDSRLLSLCPQLHRIHISTELFSNLNVLQDWIVQIYEINLRFEVTSTLNPFAALEKFVNLQILHLDLNNHKMSEEYAEFFVCAVRKLSLKNLILRIGKENLSFLKTCITAFNTNCVDVTSLCKISEVQNETRNTHKGEINVQYDREETSNRLSETSINEEESGSFAKNLIFVFASKDVHQHSLDHQSLIEILHLLKKLILNHKFENVLFSPIPDSFMTVLCNEAFTKDIVINRKLFSITDSFSFLLIDLIESEFLSFCGKR